MCETCPVLSKLPRRLASQDVSVRSGGSSIGEKLTQSRVFYVWPRWKGSAAGDALFGWSGSNGRPTCGALRLAKSEGIVVSRFEFAPATGKIIVVSKTTECASSGVALDAWIAKNARAA